MILTRMKASQCARAAVGKRILRAHVISMAHPNTLKQSKKSITAGLLVITQTLLTVYTYVENQAAALLRPPTDFHQKILQST